MNTDNFDSYYFTPQDILKNPMIRYGIAEHVSVIQRVFKQCCDYSGVYLSKHLVMEAVGSCFCDLYRLKVFRGIEQEDVHKRAAFLVKWIVKTRPIQIRHDIEDICVSTVQANEILALSTALFVLKISPTQFFRDVRFQGYMRNFVYLVHFHSCSAEQLASELYLLEQYCQSQQS